MEELVKDMKPKLIGETWRKYPTETSKHKATYGLFECQYCKKEFELNEHEEELYPFKLMSKYTADDYPFNLQRFCDTRFKMVKTDGLSDAGMGLFIDIYPLDALGNVKNGAKKQIEKKKTDDNGDCHTKSDNKR